MRRIAILVVHGVGEQTRFEHLEAIAANLYTALQNNGRQSVNLQVLLSDYDSRHAPEHGWRETPVIVRWQAADGQPVEARLREVHWADLDMAMSWRQWARLVGWALGISGVRLYDKTTRGMAAMPGMRPPKPLSPLTKYVVRVELFLVSLLFFLMLISADLLYFILKRFSFEAKALKKMRGLIYDYLGDVKLYQDGFRRKDEAVETLGEKSRVAIRRRMVRALVRTAQEVEQGELDGFFVLAHSLGTVVAFNALMEHELTLPNYLNEAEWLALPHALKCQVTTATPPEQVPKRPPWLSDSDAISRDALLSNMLGLVTMGSPLDKFATLWPAVVPVNEGELGRPVAWINIADAQDIVAGKIEGFRRASANHTIGGLTLQNIEWGDQWAFAAAHTSYWKAGEVTQRLIDRLIPWLEGGKFAAPANTLNPLWAKGIYCASLALLGWFALAVAASTFWLLQHSGEVAQTLTFSRRNFFTSLLALAEKMELWRTMADIALIGIGVVGFFSVARYGLESGVLKVGRLVKKPGR